MFVSVSSHDQEMAFCDSFVALLFHKIITRLIIDQRTHMACRRSRRIQAVTRPQCSFPCFVLICEPQVRLQWLLLYSLIIAYLRFLAIRL